MKLSVDLLKGAILILCMSFFIDIISQIIDVILFSVNVNSTLFYVVVSFVVYLCVFVSFYFIFKVNKFSNFINKNLVLIFIFFLISKFIVPYVISNYLSYQSDTDFLQNVKLRVYGRAMVASFKYVIYIILIVFVKKNAMFNNNE